MFLITIVRKNLDIRHIHLQTTEQLCEENIAIYNVLLSRKKPVKGILNKYYNRHLKQ